MKKTYEKPHMTSEAFDVEDLITASAPVPGQNGTLDDVNTQFQSPFLPLN